MHPSALQYNPPYTSEHMHSHHHSSRLCVVISLRQIGWLGSEDSSSSLRCGMWGPAGMFPAFEEPAVYALQISDSQNEGNVASHAAIPPVLLRDPGLAVSSCSLCCF
jgi:hypothetical protein